MSSVRLYSERYVDELTDEILPRLNGHIELLRTTLGHARDKLELYRDHSDGQYHGGIEHTSLIRMIKETLSVTEPEEFATGSEVTRKPPPSVSEEHTPDTCPECHGTRKTVISKVIGVEDCPECNG